MAYLLDSNVFIQAKNLFYRFSFCPGFWDWIEAQYYAGNFLSVQMVETKLKKGDDALKGWIGKTAPEGFFVTPGTEVIERLGEVAQYVNDHSLYKAAGKADFLNGADSWLIATAIVGNHKIITFEEQVRADSRKVKIPNVAKHFEVGCENLFDVMEQSGLQLKM